MTDVIIEDKEWDAGEIYRILPKVAAEIGSVPKSGENRAQNFKYRTIEATVEAFHKAAIKHGLSIIPRVKEVHRETEGKTQRCFITMEYAFFAQDGSAVVATVIGEGADSYDKATSKALTMAFKYALFQTFSIPTGDNDPDGEAVDVSKPAKPKLSRGQIDIIRSYFDTLGVESIERANYVSDVLGFEVKALMDLTPEQGDELIECLSDDVMERDGIIGQDKGAVVQALKAKIQTIEKKEGE